MDRAGVLDDAGVGGQEAGHVGPVLVEARIEAAREDGARDVAAAALEQLDGSLNRGPVEPREDEGALALHRILDADGGALEIDGAVMVEDHHVSRVDERESEVVGHDVGREPLAAAHDVLGRVLLDVLREGIELLGDGPGDAELVGDLHEARLDVVEQHLAVNVIRDVGVHEEEEIGDLVVLGETLADGGHHDEAAVAVGLDDLLDASELLGGCDARASEFADLDHRHVLLSIQAPR